MSIKNLPFGTPTVAVLGVLAALLSSCGGSSGTTAAAPTPPAAAITGLAMPTKVSVVTATNVQ